MEEGNLKCFDTPLKLKKKYGMGYLLTFIINETIADIKLLTDLVRSHINQSKMLTAVGSEITFSLAEDEAYKFSKLFETIEKNTERLGVLNFGISISTIEEVFLRWKIPCFLYPINCILILGLETFRSKEWNNSTS